MPSAARTIGMIVPPAHGRVPPDAAWLYPQRPVRFLARGLALEAISPAGFDRVADRIVEAAVELRDGGAEAVSLMGTSLSFYRGASFTETLRARMQQACGLPCTTMSHAIVASLHALGVQRVAVATAYTDVLNERLADYLESQGFAVTAVEGLDMTGVEAVAEVPASILRPLAARVVAASRDPQGLLISCGGLVTLPLHAPLEAELGLPVTSSSPAGFWDAMRTAGEDPRSAGFGRLFAIA